jgi:hypothetical protein
VRLVDGGVHDNQGVAALLEQDCTVVLASDGSRQLQSQRQPGAEIYEVPLRANGVLMARVRDAGYRELDARQCAGLLRGLMFVHLGMDLEPDPVDWIDCQEPYDVSDESRPADRRGPVTRYGVLKDVQRRLAVVRTDLDSFTDVEAYALMLSGYRATDLEFRRRLGAFPARWDERAAWRFQAIEPAMDHRPEAERAHRDLMAILDTARFRGLKFWRLCQAAIRQRLHAWLGHAGWGDTWRLRRSLLGSAIFVRGAGPLGPGGSRRVLEQRPEEPAGVEP